MITVLCWQIHQLIENVRTQMLIFCKRNSHGKMANTACSGIAQDSNFNIIVKININKPG